MPHAQRFSGPTVSNDPNIVGESVCITSFRILIVALFFPNAKPVGAELLACHHGIELAETSTPVVLSVFIALSSSFHPRPRVAVIYTLQVSRSG